MATGLAYAVLLGVQEGYDYATTSPRFEVRGLTFEPTPHVDDAHLRELMALPPGTNILSLDLDEIAARVAADPWVARATVVRVLPDALEVTVEEHEPTAVLRAGGFYLVAGDGRPFKRLEPGERGDLPIVTGFERGDLLADPRRFSARMAQALEVLTLYREKRRPRLSELNVDGTGSITLYTAELGSRLRLGRDDFATALARYDALRAALGEDSDKLAVAHLDVASDPDRPDRVVASFYSAEDAPAFVAEAQEKVVARAEAAQAREEAHEKAGAHAHRREHRGRSRIPRYE